MKLGKDMNELMSDFNIFAPILSSLYSLYEKITFPDKRLREEMKVDVLDVLENTVRLQVLKNREDLIKGIIEKLEQTKENFKFAEKLYKCKLTQEITTTNELINKFKDIK